MSNTVLSVENLSKHYPGFFLEGVSFRLERGRIMGFIGRNGAGKTTTLKSMLNFVHPDGGEIRFFGEAFSQTEFQIKQRLGFVSGGFEFYPRKKLRAITGVTRRFYSTWDEAAYQSCMKNFGLDENKTPAELSEGMKVKYALALALSHKAELLILDEPTSGLDPVSREDLLELFLTLADQGVSILFSTHITTDLEKCADDITYIKNGRLLATATMKDFLKGYKVLSLPDSLPGGELGKALIGPRRAKDGHTALLTAADAARLNVAAAPAGLEDIMVHIEKENEA